MVTVQKEGSVLRIDTDCYCAAVQTEGYVSGVMGGVFWTNGQTASIWGLAWSSLTSCWSPALMTPQPLPNFATIGAILSTATSQSDMGLCSPWLRKLLVCGLLHQENLSVRFLSAAKCFDILMSLHQY